jgi:progressive ankylosis protein
MTGQRIRQIFQSIFNTMTSVKGVFLFWLPLAFTWILMSVEGPYVSAIIARIAEPKLNLAAFGVAFSLGIFIEAPIIMIMTAATALIEDRKSYRMLRNFNIVLNAIITVMMLILITEPAFKFTTDLIGLDGKLYTLTRLGTILFIPWPAAIGFRRFYQGVLIRYGHTKKVFYGTITRLISMGLSGFLMFAYTSIDGIALIQIFPTASFVMIEKTICIPGVAVGAASLSIGVTVEAIATRIMARNAVHHYVNSEEVLTPTLTYKYISSFYVPLLLTSIITMAARPLVTLFMGHAPFPVESLAVLPVVTALVFIFRSGGIAYQEVVIALMNEDESNYKSILTFAWILGIFSTIGLVTLSTTSAADFWFRDVSGLSNELTNFSKLPLLILAVMPSLAVLVNVQRGLLVYKRKTKPVTIGSGVEMAGIIIVSVIAIWGFGAIGAVGAALGFLLGRIMVNIYYGIVLRKAA